MSKRLMLFAALVAALVLSFGTARATGTTLVAADTLFNQGSPDSTDVFGVEGAARVWADFIIPPGPPCDICFDEDADTAIVLFVQVRERLSAGAGTDSTLMPYEGISADSLLLCRQYIQGAAGNADSTVRAYLLQQNENYIPAAYSDTTVVPWIPRYNMTNATTADSVIVGGGVPSIAAPGAYEFIVKIPVFTSTYGNQARAVRVDLINVDSGAPFRAQFADIKYRMVVGPKCARIRVVRGVETW